MPECHHGSDPYCCSACATERGEPSLRQTARDETFGATTRAKFATHCPHCGDQILPHDLITKAEYGWRHVGCSPALAEVRR